MACSPGLFAQCNTTLNKLLPDGSVNNEDRFGSALAVSDKYMVVAAENSDTTGIYYGGAVYVFEKTSAGWAYRAMLTPSDPLEYDFFGNKLAIDTEGNTIVILNRNYDKGGVYIYEKPTSGWTTMTETAKVTLPTYLEFNASVDISDDGSTIALISESTYAPRYFLLSRPTLGWDQPVTPEIINGPGSNSSGAIGMDILLHQEYLYISTDNEEYGIYIYKRNGSSYQYLAKLSTTISHGQMGYFGKFLTAFDDVICATGAVSEIGKAGLKLFLFKKNGEWTDATETTQTVITGSEDTYRFPFPIQLLSSTELAASVLVREGEYYTGKVLHVTAADPSWTTHSSEVIFQEEGLSSLSEFAGTMDWNGSDLVRTVSLKSVGQASRYGAISLTHSGTVWGSLQHVTVSRNNSSFVNFGSAVIKTKDALFAGAPYDGYSGKAAGAVFIYEKSDDEFVRTHTIYPTRRKIRPTGGSDAGFGYSLAIHGDELAVAAPSYRNSPDRNGKIFLYKRQTSSWTSATLYDSLSAPDELMLNHVGAALAMNERFLFASAYNNFANEHTNAVLIYEKIDGKWTFQQLIKAGKPLNKSWPTIRFSLYGDNVLISSYAAIAGGVSLLSKNTLTGEWESRFGIGSDIFSEFGGDIKLMENHFFVGAPGYSYNGILKSGAVFVYAKLPGEEWSQQILPSAILGASTPIEGGYFGSSIDAIANTLAVGAPGKFLTEDYNVRTVPGNTYVIQAQDYYWQHTTQFMNLQGDRYAQNERDHFGADVGIDEENFYIGARNENTQTGMFSGAVYYIPSPPVIFLHPPVCQGYGVVQLTAYPPGGNWSGQGIEDPSGIFNPGIGVGIFELTYTTSNCHFTGTVQFEVMTPRVVAQLSPSEITLCSQSEIRLELEALGGTYDWYYKPEGNTDFILIGTGGAERTVTNPGEYFAQVKGLTCPAKSPVFDVHTEDLEISVGPQPVICDHERVVPLIASESAGTWEGVGVQNNNFNSGNLANKFYKLSYKFTTSSGCEINLKDSIKVNVVQPLTIHREPGDFCQTGSTFVKANPSEASLSYTWFYKPTSNSGLTAIEKPLTFEAEVFEQGFYQVIASNNDNCTATSNVIAIGFQTDLNFQVSPAENSQNVRCNESEFISSVQSRTGTNYTWEYTGTESGPYEIISNGTHDQVTVRKSGYYRVSGEYGFCSFESMPFYIEFTSDSVFVPNVFTPNGDDKNQIFEIQSSQQISQLKIFNRHGSEIYTSSIGQWDGGEHSPGVYFWFVRYEGCDTRQKELKGWVNLLR